MAGLPSTAWTRLHAGWQVLQHAASPSARVRQQHPLRQWHVHRAAFNGGMSRRALASVDEATTLAKTVQRWQACRARPRCASTPAAKCCITPSHRLHACGSSIHSRSGTCIERPSTAACRGVHLRRWMKPPRLLRLCTDGRPAEHELGAPPRRLASAATSQVAVCTRAVGA